MWTASAAVSNRCSCVAQSCSSRAGGRSTSCAHAKHGHTFNLELVDRQVVLTYPCLRRYGRHARTPQVPRTPMPPPICGPHQRCTASLPCLSQQILPPQIFPSSHLRWRPCRTPALRYYSHYSLLCGPQACICAREVVPDARSCLFHRAALGSTVHALTHPHKRPPLHGASTNPPTHSAPKASQSTSNARIFSASASCKTSHHTSHIMVACCV